MSVLAVDLETEGLHHTAGLTTISFTSANKSVAFAVNHPEQKHTERDALNKIQRIIDKTDILIAHRAHFDIKHLLNAGINLEGKKFICTKILYWLYTGHVEKNISLDKLSNVLLNKGKLPGYDFSKKKASEYPLDGLLAYNRVDTERTYECYVKLIKHIPQELIDYYSDLLMMFAELEMDGICVDKDRLREMVANTEARLAVYRRELVGQLDYPINIDSSQQLSCALYGGTFKVTTREEVREKFKTWPIWRWKSRNITRDITLPGLGFGTSKMERGANGYYSTAADVILKLKGKSKKAKEWIQTYKEYNKWNALYAKFISKYMEYSIGNYVHASFHLANTFTGRTSCSAPNIQQLPRTQEGLPNVKEIFVSRFDGGVLLDVDYSGAEWRHAAWRSGDNQMIQDIVDGLDAHTVTAMNFHGCAYDEVTKEWRQNAKPVNFRFLYGGGAYGFYMSEIVKTVEEGQAYIDGIYKRYPGLYNSHERDKAVAKGKGKLVMPSGRWYNYKGDLYKDSYVLNYPNQGSSSDMTLVTLIVANKKIKEVYTKEDVVFVNTVHDCGIWDCRTEEIAKKVNGIVRNVFTNADKYVRMYFKDMDLSGVPFGGESEIGPNWGNMKHLE